MCPFPLLSVSLERTAQKQFICPQYCSFFATVRWGRYAELFFYRSASLFSRSVSARFFRPPQRLCSQPFSAANLPVCAFSRFNRLCGTLHRDMGTPHLAVEMPGRRDQSAAAGSVKAAPYALGNRFGNVFLHDSVMERRLSFRRCGAASADAVVP